jgi:hypothetical protein
MGAFSTAYSAAFDTEGEGCSWPVSYADCTGQCDAYDRFPDAEAAQQQFEAMAIELLNAWTFGLFGVCPVAVRPCRSDCDGGKAWFSTFWGRGPGYDPGFPAQGGGGIGTGGWVPVLIGGKWFNMSCGCLSTCTCGITGGTALRLPGPIQEVTEILIDGEVLDPAAYRVEHQRVLLRVDGGTWPQCQDLLAEVGDPDTFQISYSRGVPVPVGGQVAAGRLACELALGACDDDSCALPERLQTVTRQGISVGVFTDADSWKQTGIWSIDNWVSAMNIPRPRATVRSVDVAPSRW